MKRFAIAVGCLFLAAVGVSVSSGQDPYGGADIEIRVRTRSAAPPPSRVAYVPVPVVAAPPRYAAGGCQGRSAGCQGGYAYSAPAYYGSGCTSYTAGSGCYGSAAYAGLRYGDKLAPGVYNTPSGRPAAPGWVSVPGDGFPYDGPIRRGLRAAAGYDR